MFYKTEVRNSGIHNKGLFILEPVKKGEIIGIMTVNCGIMTESEYQEEQEKGNEIIIMTGVRWAGKYFLYGNSICNEDYINHSEDPNMLYHCGICVALRDLYPGDELTINYKFLLAENDVYSFIDKETGKKVDGLSWREALIQSTEEFINLLRSNAGEEEIASGLSE